MMNIRNEMLCIKCNNIIMNSLEQLRISVLVSYTHLHTFTHTYVPCITYYKYLFRVATVFLMLMLL